MFDNRPEAPLRILIVEDDPLQGMLLLHGLKAEGHAAELAASGERAVTRLADRDFDVLVSDIDLPGINGLGVMMHSRKSHPSGLIVAMTGSHTKTGGDGGPRGQDISRRVELAGANALLFKPFPLEALLSILSPARSGGTTRKLPRQRRQPGCGDQPRPSA